MHVSSLGDLYLSGHDPAIIVQYYNTYIEDEKKLDGLT